MAAPVFKVRTPKGTGANSSTQSANGSRAIRRGQKNLSKNFLRKEDGRTLWCLPLVGQPPSRSADERLWLTRQAFSWKPRPQGAVSRVFQQPRIVFAYRLFSLACRTPLLRIALDCSTNSRMCASERCAPSSPAGNTSERWYAIDSMLESG